MKHLSKILSIILAGVATGCLIAAGIIYLDGKQDDMQSEQVLDAFRTAAQSETSDSRNESSEEQSGQADEEQSGETLGGDQSEASQCSDQTGPSQGGTSQADADKSSDPSGNTEEVTLVDNPYADSYRANDDMAAWLLIPDTVIDYPVMWTPEDENYYLYRDFDKAENKNGCLILDTDSSLDPLTTNLIIHGHNMKSGAMFGNLTDYEKKDYYEKHKQIILYTPERQRIYEVIAVFRSQVYKKSDQVFKFYKFFQADTEEEFLDFYDNIKALSLYDTGVTARFGDHFITLSTCVYHVENGRFVVVAKEVEGGDMYLPLE